MRTNVILFCIAIILVITESCTSSPINNAEKLSYIDWDSLEYEDYLKEPHTSISFIKLETNDNCIINEIKKVEIDDSLIFIQDYMQRLFLFQKDGRFVRKIGEKGGAENEYVTLFDFVLNRRQKQLYLVDSSKGKILIFNYDGNYLGSKDIETHALSHFVKVAFVDDDCLATVNYNSPDEKHNFSLFDIESQHATDYIGYISIGNLSSSNEVGRTTCQSSNLLMCAELSDTIYTCKNREIYPLYVFNGFAKHATKDDIEQGKYDFGTQPESKLLKDGFSCGIINLYATDRIISFQCRTKEGFYRIFYNAETKKGYKYDITKDLDADNTALWNWLTTSSAKAFVCALPVGEFLTKEKVRNTYPELNNLLNNSKDEDNPILAFFNVAE